MFARVTYRVLVLAILATSACANPQAGDSELPPIEAPLFASKDEEVGYLFAQIHRYLHSTVVEDDMNFDSRNHVHIQFHDMMLDFRDWHGKLPATFAGWIERELAPTPAIFRYRGARQNAVALGLLAYSIWRRDPERESVTIEKLQICARSRWSRRCGVEARALVLQRMMLVADSADRDLYESLRRKLPPVQVQKTRYVPAATAPAATSVEPTMGTTRESP